MPKWNRQVLDKYCYDYHVPIISFISSKPNDQLVRVKIKGSSLHFWQNQTVQEISAEPSPVHKITKTGCFRRNVPSKDWVLFENSGIENYESLLTVRNAKGKKFAAVVRDKGKEDGVQRILFGHNITDWSVKLCFLDSLWWALGNEQQFSLDRFVQIDIDDIFVGAQGTRLVESDVRNLLTSQDRFKSFVDDFKFMLGFSGSYFRNGNVEEDRGDELLIELAPNFVWFPHMWRHNHAHEHNITYLKAIMAQNKLFAQNMRLPTPYAYAIAPQHDGVFPVHEDLYDAWKEVWGVKVTATEEYPHFKPSAERRAFMHKDVSVLPRQTCGLYTHTQFFDNYPDGFDKVISSIEGGDLFFTILTNKVSIFMTHQQNYAHDRLAIYTFENLFRFVNCWTNVHLKWQDPEKSAEEYFRLYPLERLPVWSNPCVDPRHRLIVPASLTCANLSLPNLLIVGPQKTGSTALGFFLELHPNVTENSPDPQSFEELQFFGGGNYRNGVGWYSSHFRKSQIMFEKSATYFDNPLVAQQAASLVPHSDIVVILFDPAKRAYSWFQHILAHNDPVAIGAGNLEAVLNNESSFLNATGSEQLKKIRQRCLSGGRYTFHLDRWLEHFSLAQIHFVDGELLKEDPIQEVTKLSNELRLPEFDFGKFIRFSSSKGHHCKLVEEKTKCLGKSKGRLYPPMSESLKNQLDHIFALDNAALYKFLKKNRKRVPKWLQSALV